MANIEDPRYWAERDRRLAAETAAGAGLAQSPVQQINALCRKLDALYADKGAHTETEIAEVQAQLNALEAQVQATEAAAFAAEWTPEMTAARRTIWNALIKSGQLSKGGKVDMLAVRKAERAQGWTLDDLKRAVALHKL